MAVKIMSKWELKRVGRAVGATPIVKLECPTPDEMGYADEVNFCEISSTWCTVFRRDTDENKMATIILRGSTHAVLDDIERAIDNGVNAVKSLIRDNRLVAGGGATEIFIANEARFIINAFAINGCMRKNKSVAMPTCFVIYKDLQARLNL